MSPQDRKVAGPLEGAGGMALAEVAEVQPGLVLLSLDLWLPGQCLQLTAE